MSRRKDLFDWIAPLYGLFYSLQKSNYRRILQQNIRKLNIKSCASVLDVGCGTGAFCSALQEMGFQVTGIDTSQKMLQVARRKNHTSGIVFLQGSVLTGLPFEDGGYDCVLASYVAHGFTAEDRAVMYREMNRVSRDLVLIHDFNQKSSSLIRWIEALEKSDYDNFLKYGEDEMRQYFKTVQIMDVSSRAAWMVGRK